MFNPSHHKCTLHVTSDKIQTFLNKFTVVGTAPLTVWSKDENSLGITTPTTIIKWHSSPYFFHNTCKCDDKWILFSFISIYVHHHPTRFQLEIMFIKTKRDKLNQIVIGRCFCRILKIIIAVIRRYWKPDRNSISLENLRWN